MLRTVMSSIMRRRRGLISAIWKLLSEGSDRHPHPLRQETCHATKPLTPRQRLRSIPNESQQKAAGIRPESLRFERYREFYETSVSIFSQFLFECNTTSR